MNYVYMEDNLLQHFASGTAVQGTAGVSNTEDGSVTPYAVGEGLSAEMHTYYSDYLIDNAEPYLAHDLFAQKHVIPAGAKTISFRKYDPLPKRMTPITEGVTPDGQNLRVSVVEATVAQYGGYVELTDLLLLSAVDNNLCMATKLLGILDIELVFVGELRLRFQQFLPIIAFEFFPVAFVSELRLIT